MVQYLLNGKTAQHVDIADRGLQYGDGFFTTIRVEKGTLKLWPLHWQRLCECADRLGFAEFRQQVTEKQLVADCQHLLLAQSDLSDELVIRITITRGRGGRGYAPPQPADFNVLVGLSQMPDLYARWREEGVTLAMSQLRLGDQPILNGLKTLNRLEQVLLKQELSDLQARHPVDDLLVLDQRGFIAESSAANLIWYRGGQWYSPALQHGGVRGVMCQAIQQRLLMDKGDYSLGDLLAAEHLFICNALMGPVSVKQLMIDATTMHHFSVSSQLSCELTKRISENE